MRGEVPFQHSKQHTIGSVKPCIFDCETDVLGELLRIRCRLRRESHGVGLVSSRRLVTVRMG